MKTKREPAKDFDEAVERWLRKEIPARLAELAADPSQGVPVDEVFRDLEAMHQARLRDQ